MSKKTRYTFWIVILVMAVSLVVLKSKNSNMQKMLTEQQSAGN